MKQSWKLWAIMTPFVIAGLAFGIWREGVIWGGWRWRRPS